MGIGGKAGKPEAARIPSQFATTHWSLVQSARDTDRPEAAGALAKLCCAYWHPVHAQVRRRGYNDEDARDLTQDFFAQLLRDETLAAADRERGRFRCFLLGVLKRFLAHTRHRAQAQKRGGDREIVSWDQVAAESNGAAGATDGESPDRAFDRHWALAVLQAAHERLRAEHAAGGRSAWFETLQPYLTAEPDAPSYAATAARLGVSEGAVKSAIHRLRQRYFVAVRDEVAHTVTDAAELEDELRYLRAVFAGVGPAP
jgi:RNA polymerase sigma-70 factor (ECF subfamily)